MRVCASLLEGGKRRFVGCEQKSQAQHVLITVVLIRERDGWRLCKRQLQQPRFFSRRIILKQVSRFIETISNTRIRHLHANRHFLKEARLHLPLFKDSPFAVPLSLMMMIY